jgi:RND family efflux transporter MFP subunit
MKKWVILIALLGAGFGGYSVWNNWQKTKPAANASNRPTTATVELRDISFAVNAAGEISPAEQVSVRPEINGKIDVLPVDIGDHTKKGDLLFKLDDKELQQERSSNLTDIEKAKLGVEKAERDYKRAQRLLEEKLISQEIYDDAKTTFDLAKNALERAQRDLAITDEHLSYTKVRAPFDCTILTRPVSVGQAVSGSGGFNSGTEVLTIADLNSMIINAQVNQADVPRLKPDQSVEVTIEAVPGLKVFGTVERISPQATIKNNLKGYAARIILKDPDSRIRPGMTANVKIPVASAENVTAVPLAAVFTEKNPDTELVERFVYIQQGENFEKRIVKVGVTDYFFAEIQQGLKEGETVSLEMPKEEREKKVQEMATQRHATKHAENRTGPAPVAAIINSNTPPATQTTTGGGQSTPSPKTRPSINGPRTEAGASSTH